ncbi:hypothetical protein GCM10010353_62320 [Streptomyces chryseus]|nr:hypothetical protein GCM10010353_62320 [Streptomyces chryseus]
MGLSYSVETWCRDFQYTLNVPSRVGVYCEPNRTSMAETTRPSIIQDSVRLVLLMHRTRPVMQRGSGAATGAAVGGRSSALVGSRVMPTSLPQVTVSVVPVRGRARLPWNDDTAAAVTEP